MSVGGWVTVSTAQGALKGKKDKSVTGKPYCAFLAIPYAKPPIGELRFKPPEPAEKWTGIRDATKVAQIAPQQDFMSKQIVGDEDCLYLNVYAPRAPTGSSADLLPVFLWIHGGGLIGGSGNAVLYGPDYLLEHDIIVVTINYRLGALGFASLNGYGITGNMGLKDLVLGLRWIKDNIRSFGGDPNNVTICGESAGSACCHALILSPMAKGLFHRAIMQSATTIAGDLSIADMSERTLALAESVGATSRNPEEVAAFLKSVPAEKLVSNYMDARTKEDKQRNVQFPFVVTVEPEDAEGGAFFSRSPLDILQSGDYAKVPIITGVCSKEGGLFLMDLPGKISDLRTLNTNLQTLLPLDLPVSKGERMTVAREVKRFYFGNEPLEEDTLEQYLDLRGDTIFNYPGVKAARLHASKSTTPVYFYVFSVDAGLNFSKLTFNLNELKGACHGDDLGYMFRAHVPGADLPVPSPDSVEGKSIARLTTMWTNFAKTGHPILVTDSLLETTWPQFNPKDGSYLEISNDKISVHKHPFKERMDFWDRLYSRKN